ADFGKQVHIVAARRRDGGLRPRREHAVGAAGHRQLRAGRAGAVGDPDRQRAPARRPDGKRDRPVGADVRPPLEPPGHLPIISPLPPPPSSGQAGGEGPASFLPPRPRRSLSRMASPTRAKKRSLGRHDPRRARLRLVVAVLVGFAVWWIVPARFGHAFRVVAGWDAAALSMGALTWLLIFR